MPHEITLDIVPSGVAGSSARKDEKGVIAIREFSSSEDGDSFIQRLEGLANSLLSRLPNEAKINPSLIDHLLVVIRRDKTATFYINELPFKLGSTIEVVQMGYTKVHGLSHC